MRIRSFYYRIKDSKTFKIIKNKYLLVSLFFIVWILFIDTNNLFNFYSNIRTVILQENQKKYYKEAIIHIDERLNELSSNRDSLEKYARERFLFHEPDEVIYIVEQQSLEGNKTQQHKNNNYEL